MTFLNPAVLFGLLAASIPVLLHFLNLRRLRTIDFSTLTFLKELQKSTLRKLKLQQWLLLLLRTLLILFIVLAFSRPVIHGSLIPGLGSKASTLIILVLDDTPSMNRIDEKGNLFSQAIDAANRIIELINDGDEILLLKVSESSATQMQEPTSNSSFIRKLLRDSKVSPVHRPIDDAIRFAARIVQTSHHPNNEIYIISDFQRNCFDKKSDSSGVSKYFSASTGLFLLPVGPAKMPNAGITDIRIQNSLLDLQRPVFLTASVKNFGDEPLKSLVASLYAGTTRVQQKSTDISPGETQELSFSFTPQQRGIIDISVRLEEDQFEADNVRYFSLSIPKKISILLAAQNQADLEYLQTALAIAGNEQQSNLFSIRTSLLSQNFDISDCQVAMCVVSSPLPTATARKLNELIQHGGCAVFFPASTITRQTIQSLISQFSLPIADTLVILNKSSYLTFEHFEYDHPIFQNMFESQNQHQQPRQMTQRFADAPQIWRSLFIRKNPKWNSLITLSNNSSFFAEEQRGPVHLSPKDFGGHLLICAVPPTSEWSDLPLKGFFIPLIYRAVLYGSGMSQPPLEASCGDKLIFHVPSLRENENSTWILHHPDGDEEKLQPISNFQRSTFSYSSTSSLPGFYPLMTGDKKQLEYAVNISPDESDLHQENEESIQRHFLKLGFSNSRINYIKPDEHIASTVQQARYGRELWPLAILLAIACAIGEMIITERQKIQAKV